MAAERRSYNGLMHAGGGTVLFLLPLSAMIPGLLPFIALAGVFTAVLVIPLLVLGLVAALLATPPLGVWLLVRRVRGRRVESGRVAPAAAASAAYLRAAAVPNPARTR
jgi:hypothetical protein